MKMLQKIPCRSRRGNVSSGWSVLKTIRADRTPEAGMEKEIQAWRIPLRDCRSRSYMIWMWKD